MSGVFISHAHHDKPLVDPFVDDVIRLGCEVPASHLFYSSGEDTGIPSGEDLNSYVRKQVGTASIVVAIISPAFQTRPFCVAELGAAWSAVGKLFPIAMPGMARTDLEGVLTGMIVRYLDEPDALDELHDRVGDAVGSKTSAQTWGRFRAKWLAGVSAYTQKVPPVRAASLTDLERTEADLEAARGALEQSERDRRELVEKVERLKDAITKEDAAEILLPADEKKRFEALRSDVRERVGRLPSIVVDAMWYDLFDGGMPRPNRFDNERDFDFVEEAERDGLLVPDDSALLVPDRDVTKVDDAYDAVDRLRKFLDNEGTPEFSEWFRDEHGMGPNLRKKALWDQLVRPRSSNRLW